MARAVPALCLLVAACQAGDLHNLATSGVLGTPAPATSTTNVLYVSATIDQSPPARLLVDTGAALTILEPSRWPGATIPNGSTRIDHLTIGGLTLSSVPALGIAIFPDRPGWNPGGILGANVICQFATVLDYRGATVRLADGPPTDIPDLAPPAPAIDLRVEGGGSGVLGNTTFTYPATRVPVTVVIDGKPRSLILDTGSTYLVLRHALWTELASDGRPRLTGLPILSASGAIAGSLTRARAVTVGTETVTSPPVLDIGDNLLNSFADEVHHPVDGFLGGAFLREFLVTLDFPHYALRLSRYTTQPHIDPHEFHLVALTLEPAPANSPHRFRIAHIFPNTSAASSSLQVGQLLLSIDAHPLDNLGTEEAEKLLHGPPGTTRQIVTDSTTATVQIDDLLPPP